jgi:hypothetical protein
LRLLSLPQNRRKVAEEEASKLYYLLVTHQTIADFSQGHQEVEAVHQEAEVVHQEVEEPVLNRLSHSNHVLNRLGHNKAVLIRHQTDLIRDPTIDQVNDQVIAMVDQVRDV